MFCNSVIAVNMSEVCGGGMGSGEYLLAAHLSYLQSTPSVTVMHFLLFSTKDSVSLGVLYLTRALSQQVGYRITKVFA